MSTLKFPQFTKPAFLRQIGRTHLDQFLARFTGHLAANKLTLPPPGCNEHDYFTLLAHMLMSPEGLPLDMAEALHAMHALANPEGQQRLEQAIAEHRLPLTLASGSSHGDIAMQVWLAAPDLLARKHNEARLVRLCTFHHFGAKLPRDCTATFTPPGAGIIGQIERHCDRWFAEHNRGRKTTKIEVHLLNSECWFLVRHGDTYSRTSKVEQGRIEPLHFRPTKDDVVVHSPRRDELRINARTVGERDLYRAAFGLHLFGDATYFSERQAYTLHPLREAGVDSLDLRGIAGLNRIILREYEITLPGDLHETDVRAADDIFAAARAKGRLFAIPPKGELLRATFDVYFTGVSAPRKVQIRPPNTLRTSRHGDAIEIDAWLTAAGFRVPLATAENISPPPGQS